LRRLSLTEEVPVASSARQESSRLLAREVLRSRLVWLSLLVGMACTVAWATLAAQRKRDQARRDFEERAAVAAAQVEQSFRAPLEGLYGIHALASAWPDIDQHRFELFAKRLVDRYPSLAALELFDVVKGEDRADFERRVSAELGRPFTIQEPAGGALGRRVVSPPRSRHVVLTRLWPYHPDLHGLDIEFETVRRSQISAAAQAGKPLVTGRFRLVEDPEGVFSVAVYYALYAAPQGAVGQVPASVQERERLLRGFAIALYRLSPLMNAALLGTKLEDCAVALIDLDAGMSTQDALLFRSSRPGPADFAFRRELHFAGRAWSLEVSRAAPASLLAAMPSLAVGSIGSLLLTVLVGLLVSLRKSRERFQALEELGPYTLLREIGSGGMGRVFEAQHQLLRRRAAIKLIAHEGASEEHLRRFDLEAKITSELRHPNTVVVFDYGRTLRGDFYYAMEYLDGINLERLVAVHGPQPAARVRHILVQVCGALAEAHGLGLVHRDIKPSNLMLGVSGGIFDFVKVLDFGLVRVTRGREAGASAPGGLLGTPRYMAPESFASSQSGPRADLYALGCVAYFLISGQEPFSAKTDAGIAALHLTQRPAPLGGRGIGDLSPAFERVILRCLAKSPDDRFGSAALLMRALQELELPAWTQAHAASFWADFAARRDASARPVS
jgi:CHASE1-domain containing sensor protein